MLPTVSIDDFVFGVAAIVPDGQESLISAYDFPEWSLLVPKKVS